MSQSSSCELRKVSGIVYGNNIGLEGVAVTDGLNITSTDKNGYYELICDNEAQFVYISTPSGYAAPVESGVIRFFHHLENNNQNMKKDFRLTKTADERNHAFVVVSDIQILRDVEFPMLKESINDIKNQLETYPQDLQFHVLDCGDLVFDRLDFYPEYISSFSDLNLPIYRILGNHDMDFHGRSHESSMKTFNKTFGPDYYSFNRGEVHYVVLNDVFFLGREYFYMGYITERQLEWLSRDLSYVKPGTPVVVALHIPTTYPGENFNSLNYYKLSLSLVNNSALYNILKPYNTHIVSGHNHTSASYIINENLMEHNIPAISGSWWQTDICPDGTPAGYVIFDVKGKDITWQYKAVGKSITEQFAAYPQGKDSEQPDAFIVNVWKWDSQWKVEWYQDNVYKGEMERFTGKDPLISEILTDRSKFIHSWISAGDTEHLFRVFPDKEAKKIKVKVTDRFGNVYEKTVEI